MKVQIKIIGYLLFPILCTVWGQVSHAQGNGSDSLRIKPDLTEKYNTFYDSLKSKAGQNKFTRMLHQALFTTGTKKADSLRNLDIFGSMGAAAKVFSPSARLN